jgi:nucleotide-binding universal stress UspA family protein
MQEIPDSPPTRPILIAVDFSADSDAAIGWGLRQAARCKLPVLLFHAIHDSAEAPGFYIREGDAGRTRIEEVAQEMMDAQMDRIAADLKRLKVKATALLVPGLPAGRIVEVAEDRDCDLIVIGSRGRSALKSLLLGSVAETVVQKATVPVVVVKAPRKPDPNAESAGDPDPAVAADE